MNLETVFEFIKEKRGYNYPVRYKLIEGLPLSEDELNVEGDLDFTGTYLNTLPDNLTVNGFLDLYESSIKSLPNNLMVDGMSISYTNLNSLPNNLYINGPFYLVMTPLSKKYSIEKIRKIIEEKGGYVKGKIYR